MLGEDATSKLAVRMNDPGKDRLAVMWEVVVLHALSKLGTLQHEIPLSSGRKPDVNFSDGHLLITADIRAVSDESLHEQNPVQELSDLIEKEKTRLGLAIGGLKLKIESSTEHSSRGRKVVLRIPERKRLSMFVRDKVVPELKRQIREGIRSPSFTVDDGTTLIHVLIDPDESPYSSTSYASYDQPLVRDRNPLYNALHDKAKKQLRNAPGLVGVIVGDGDSKTLADPMSGSGAITGRAIAEEFLRQHTSIHFVLLLSVREQQHVWPRVHDQKRWLSAEVVYSKSSSPPPELEVLFHRMMELLPEPVVMPINAARRAREQGYGLGHHGGYKVSGNRVKSSAREVLEVLAGRCTVDEINGKYDELTHGRSAGPPNSMPRWIELYLGQGRMPTKISVIKTDENQSDDWIEFEFGPPDPAITPFR